MRIIIMQSCVKKCYNRAEKDNRLIPITLQYRQVNRAGYERCVFTLSF